MSHLMTSMVNETHVGFIWWYEGDTGSWRGVYGGWYADRSSINWPQVGYIGTVGGSTSNM